MGWPSLFITKMEPVIMNEIGYSKSDGRALPLTDYSNLRRDELAPEIRLDHLERLACGVGNALRARRQPRKQFTDHRS